MKYIRTYGDYNSWKLDYSNPDRGFRLKPTLYKYPHGEDNILLENDDPRKHGDSTYMRIYIGSDTEFSFYIGNKSGDTQTTMKCTIDWGDGVIEDKNITADGKGFKLSHNYTGRNFREIELYNVERDYSIVGDSTNYTSLISHPSIVKNVILGNSVVNIGEDAFGGFEGGCTSLTSVHIPESVTSIGERAFYYCESLTSIYIPEGVTSIGTNAFYGCSSLTSVHISESVTSIGGGVLGECTSLISIHIPEGVTTIGNSTLYNCTSLTSVYIPEGVTSIGSDTFIGCSSLISVYIPESVTKIGGGAFNYCTGLTSVNIPESVTSIGGSAFSNCTGLTSINIPEGVTSISNVFMGCSSLTSILIPERVTEILNYAFDNCTSLISISSLNTTAPTLGLFDSGQYTIFTNLPKNGTLHIKPGATGYDAWLKSLPSGWTIVEDL